MSRDGQRGEVGAGAEDSAAGCPLSDPEQTRNILIFAVNWALVFLSSPVTYVGVVQATLVDRLGYRNVAANLPAAVYLLSAPLAVVVIWLVPQVRRLKVLLVAVLLATAVMGGVVAAALVLGGAGACLAALVAHAAVWGCCNGVFATCQWEMMGRGVAATRRGQALGLAFGAGPVLAVIASLGSDYLLRGTILGFGLGHRLPQVGYPWNFAGLYGASVLVLALAAWQSNLYVVPQPAVEAARQPFVSGVFGGFREFLGSRPILFAGLGYILVYSGHEVLQNVSLYTREALGESPAKYAGLQLTLRFGFKIAAGFFLGWLLTRTNPRFLLLVTAALCFAGVLWALLVPGPWFLVSFGIIGAGELFGVYYYNYILDCSPRSQMRRNMVFTALITLPIGFAPVIYGKISDSVGRVDKRLGFQVSFVVALAVLALTMLLVRLTLPERPRPPDDAGDEMGARGRCQGADPFLERGGRDGTVILKPLDIGCFVIYMLLLIGTGVYFTRQRKSLKSYLLADQDIPWIIVAVSVLAALFSGITYLGAPAESYYHDLGYIWVMVSFFIATPITTLVFLPFFRGLNVFTAYEYLERRFDRRLRRIASALFLTRVTLYLATVIYAPALAIMEITAWPLWLSVLLTGCAATLYTTLGGMKAVIWTDSLQFLVLCGGILLILGFAIAEVPGGLPVAWEHASKAGRTRFVNLDLDPTVRVTFWGALIGGTCHNLVQMVTDQISVQRYLTAKSLEECQRALWFKLAVTLPLVLLFYLTGTVLFGYYQAYPGREPVVNQVGQVIPRAEAGPGEDVQPLGGGQQNRILPFYVVHQLPSPLPGILIAAVFGATIAVVSAGINALATAALMDFGGASEGGRQAESRRFLLARGLTVLFGVVATALALGIGRLGTLVEVTVKIFGVFGGPLLGFFFLGAFSRRANGPGALLGGIGGAVAGLIVAFSGQLLPWNISMMWIPATSTAVTFLLGLLASLGFRAPGPEIQALVFHGGRKLAARTEASQAGSTA